MWIGSLSIVVITVASAIACIVGLILFLQRIEQVRLHPNKRAHKSMGNHSGVRTPDARRWQDELLLHQMRSRQLDPELVMLSQPVMFRQLLARCRLCESRTRCECDLNRAFTSKSWPAYCPNGPTLNMINALRGSVLSV